MVRTIAPEALAERLLNGDDDDVLVLDLRSPQEWDASGFHIPGALRLPDQELTCLGLSTPRLPADELVVLYGDARDAALRPRPAGGLPRGRPQRLGAPRVPAGVAPRSHERAG